MQCVLHFMLPHIRVTNRKVSFMSFINTSIGQQTSWMQHWAHLITFYLTFDYMHLRLKTSFVFTENGFPTESQSWNLNIAIWFMAVEWLCHIGYIFTYPLLWDHWQSTNDVPFDQSIYLNDEFDCKIYWKLWYSTDFECIDTRSIGMCDWHVLPLLFLLVK